MKILTKRRPRARLSDKFVHSTKGGSLARAADGHTVLVDTREQVPWNLQPFATRTITLETGDYQLLAESGLVAIERKGGGLSDLMNCVGHDRVRFERELERLTVFRFRYVIVEGSWLDLCSGRYRGTIPAQSAIGTIAAWQVRYQIPFLFADTRPAAEALAIRLLVNVARGA